MKGKIKVGGGAQETPRRASLLSETLLAQIPFTDDIEKLLVPAVFGGDNGE